MSRAQPIALFFTGLRIASTSFPTCAVFLSPTSHVLVSHIHIPSSWISSIPETDYYIANSERFSIRVRHGVRGQIIPRSVEKQRSEQHIAFSTCPTYMFLTALSFRDSSGTNTGNHAMKGRLVNTNGGSTLRSWPSNTPFAGVVPQDGTRSVRPPTKSCLVTALPLPPDNPAKVTRVHVGTHSAK
jgi:hypothetical protein